MAGPEQTTRPPPPYYLSVFSEVKEGQREKLQKESLVWLGERVKEFGWQRMRLLSRRRAWDGHCSPPDTTLGTLRRRRQCGWRWWRNYLGCCLAAARPAVGVGGRHAL